MKIPFTKMQSLGNDFILVDNRNLRGLFQTGRSKKISRISKILCDRRFGIGADQLLLLDTSKKADFKMRIFNADGTEVEMCGNGISCLAKYIWDKKIRNEKLEIRSKKAIPKRRNSNSLAIETPAGIIYLKKTGSLIKIDMGEPVFEPKKIPVRIRKKAEIKKSQLLNFSTSQLPGSLQTPNSKPIVNYPLQINDKTFKITCVSIGNPHTVIVIKNVQTVPLSYYGPTIENHRFFPKRTNVEFIQILNRKNIKMRVWERGAGETMACGTGASAVGVASSLLGLTDRKVAVHLPGGKLLIEWTAEDNHVYMTGPAVKVFEGTIDI